MAISHYDRIGPRSARRRKPRAPWRALLLVLLIMALLVTGGVLYAFTMVTVAVEEISEPLPPELAPEARPTPVQVGQRVNILVMGLDEERLRSDTMLLVSVDPESRKVGILQIPRDTQARLAGKGSFEKINAAYAFGVGDKQFPANLRALKTVEDLLDVTIHHTAVVDLTSFRRIVDEVGGVWVDVPRKMDYDDPEQGLHIHLKPGRQKLDGQKALEFVRWRHNNDGTGYPDQDLGRIRTQQQFLRNLMDELLKPSNLPLLPNQMAKLARYAETTMEPARILSMATLAAQMDKKDVEFATLPGTDAYVMDPQEKRRLSFFLPDPTATRLLVDRLIRGIDPVAAAKIRVELIGNGDGAMTTRIADRLTGQGFIVSVAPASGAPPEKSRVIDLTGDESKANKGQLVGRSLVSQGLMVEIVSQAESHASVDVRVVLGRELPEK